MGGGVTDDMILCRLREKHAWDDEDADSATCQDCGTIRVRTDSDGWKYTYPPTNQRPEG